MTAWFVHEQMKALRLLCFGLGVLGILSEEARGAAALDETSSAVAGLVTGAVIDETTVRDTVVVDATGKTGGSVATITAGIERALDSLRQGRPTRVQIHSATYRESAAHLRLDEPIVRDTLLVLEAVGGPVVWTGCDLINETWTEASPGLWWAPWTLNFGPYSQPWGCGLGVGARRELLFRDGYSFRPAVLDRFSDEGFGYTKGDVPRFEYLETLDPAATLSPGQFGVSERGPAGSRIWLKLQPGERPERMETAARNRLLDVTGHRGLVLRGITFTGCANSERELVTDCPIFTGWDVPQQVGDVLIEDCRFLWNSAIGLHIHGYRWTLRNCVASYNGYSGISIGDSRNVLLEDCKTHFNCWREYLAGVEDWNYAGIKVQQTAGLVLRNHQCVGNADHGLWWDIHCSDTLVDGGICLFNRRSLIHEISPGPIVIRGLLAVGGFRETKPDGNLNAACLACNTGRSRFESCIFVTDRAPEVAGLLWYEREDPHAKTARLQPDLHELVNCVVVAGPEVTAVLREANVGDRQQVGWRSFRYAGRGNVFWHAGGKTDVFQFTDENYTSKRLDFAGWCRERDEHQSQFVDPRFRDVAGFDFRAATKSPLADRTDLPLVEVSGGVLTAARDHFQWLGWTAHQVPTREPAPARESRPGQSVGKPKSKPAR